jgi:predicted RNase H-like nuclease
MAVAGVDVWSGRWVAVLLAADGSFRSASTAVGIAELVSGLLTDSTQFGEKLDLIAIDIPIGLPDFGARRADLQARAALGVRRASLFVTPVRIAVQEADYHCANRLHRERTGGGMSKQAHGLRTSILDVDGWLAGTPQVDAIEVHPELCFTLMTGAPMAHAKRTWSGMRARLAALSAQGVELPADLGPAGSAGVDDILDAAAAAWSAGRYLRGVAVAFPPTDRATTGQGGELRIWA